MQGSELSASNPGPLSLRAARAAQHRTHRRVIAHIIVRIIASSHLRPLLIVRWRRMYANKAVNRLNRPARTLH